LSQIFVFAMTNKVRTTKATPDTAMAIYIDTYALRDEIPTDAANPRRTGIVEETLEMREVVS
jgi:hypothetical protein